MAHNVEFMARWAAALRSGEYQQGFGTLHDSERDLHCVLGVACDLLVKDGMVEVTHVTDDYEVEFDGRVSGFSVDVSRLIFGDSYCSFENDLSFANDMMIPFSVLADRIDAFAQRG